MVWTEGRLDVSRERAKVLTSTSLTNGRGILERGVDDNENDRTDLERSS